MPFRIIPGISEFITFQRGRSEHSNRKYQMQKHILFAAFLCGFSVLANAVDEVNLDEVVVTASRIKQPLNKTLSSTSVITQEDIQNSQAIDVLTLLKTLPGVEFSQSGGIGKQSSIFMRGTNSNQVLVLLDGVRVNSATTGATAIDQIMLDQVERIEVVRGNVSSLYGSEAIGGVIQIFTKQGNGNPSWDASAGIATYNTQRASVGYGGKVSDTTFNLQVSRFRTDGISAIKPDLVPSANPDNDGYDNTSVSGNLYYALNSDHGLTASVFNTQGETQYDLYGYGVLASDVQTSKSQLQKLALGSENKLSDNWSSKLQLSQGFDNLENYTNGAASGNIKTTSNQAGWQNTLTLDKQKSLLLGVESLKQQVASDTIYTQTDRQVNSLFGGYSALYGAHQIQLNLRSDRYSDFGPANTSLIGYGYMVDDAWRITVNASTAFRAPTFNDMYAPAAWGANPNLTPERSNNSELGIHYATLTQQIDLVYFDNKITDLIQYQYPLSQNIAKARIEGAEFNYAAEFGDTKLKVAVTGQNPRDVKTGQALLRRAKLFSNVGITHKFVDWRIGGEWQYSGEREDYYINTSNRTTLDSYNLINLTANYKINKHLDASLRADNIFNQDYMLVHGYNTLGRTLFVGINYKE
jgi:vitamin B12 transporter